MSTTSSPRGGGRRTARSINEVGQACRAASRQLRIPRFSNESVLVVDDEEGLRELHKSALKMLGCQADAVGSGEEALEYLRDHQVDLLVLDMTMPGMDGAETYRRALLVRPGQRAIVLSGLPMDARIAEMLDTGASVYVQKPVSLERLAQAIRHGLGLTSR